jgi:hypothetical protein
MRILFLAPFLLAAACSVENDPANDQVGVKYDQERIERGAAEAARTAKQVGTGIGNVAASAGRAVKNEVGDVDVDVDVSRNRDRSQANQPDGGNSQR